MIFIVPNLVLNLGGKALESNIKLLLAGDPARKLPPLTNQQAQFQEALIRLGVRRKTANILQKAIALGKPGEFKKFFGRKFPVLRQLDPFKPFRFDIKQKGVPTAAELIKASLPFLEPSVGKLVEKQLPKTPKPRAPARRPSVPRKDMPGLGSLIGSAFGGLLPGSAGAIVGNIGGRLLEGVVEDVVPKAVGSLFGSRERTRVRERVPRGRVNPPQATPTQRPAPAREPARNRFRRIRPEPTLQSPTCPSAPRTRGFSFGPDFGVAPVRTRINRQPRQTLPLFGSQTCPSGLGQQRLVDKCQILSTLPGCPIVPFGSQGPRTLRSARQPVSSRFRLNSNAVFRRR